LRPAEPPETRALKTDQQFLPINNFLTTSAHLFVPVRRGRVFILAGRASPSTSSRHPLHQPA
jgi:hypothetical protein